MRKTTNGFTIVELLIVIVVIGILAAITVVAFNGVQQRAKNEQTTSALTSWLKALHMHKVDKGAWPNAWACLGTGYKYNLDGAGSSGYGQCRQTGASWGVTENAAFVTAMRPYIGNTLPTPAFITTTSTPTDWQRGITYAFGGGAGTDVYVQVVYAGQLSTCPVAAGYAAAARSVWDTNTLCHYSLGQTTDS